MSKDKIKEIVMYVIFGVLTTLVSWISYTVLINLCSFSVFWSNFVSWILSISFAYITNKLWVFNSKSWMPKILLKEITTFVGSRGITGIIEIVCVPLLAKTGFDNIFYNIIEKIGMTQKVLFTDGIYSKISLAIIVVILNYVFSKLIIFKNKDEK